MNYFKFLICWWYKAHIFTWFRDKDGNPKLKCVRCGCTR